ncbi:MAG TPA: choice-of-anchor P family protein [Acidimicrobiales bacterium]|nr:choice-of-anchor P family protein [Acidimicrobiales bacterium]
MKRRILHLLGAGALVGTIAGVGLVGAAPAGADTSLIGWTAQSDANMVDVVVDNAAGLAGSHPLSQIDIPEDTSDFETGPLGYGLSTLLWPGAVGGNIGSLLGEAGAPSQLAPITDKLNDPFKAESFYPAGPASATFPSGTSTNGAIEMTSHADVNGSWAKAGLADVTVPGLFDLRAVQGSTTATATDVAKSTASGAFHSLSLLGGMITIGATDSTASAESDGNSPDGTATTHLGAITIGGQQVSVGSDGVIAGPASSSGLLSALPTSVVNQVVSLLDLKITPLPQTETNQAPAEQITSGGLQISFSLPSNINLSLNCTSLPSQLAQLGILCTIPDVMQGMSFTFTIGRVTAEAIAAPPFAISVDQAGLGLLPGVGATAADSGSGGPLDLGLPGATTGATGTPAGTGTVPNQSIRHAAPVSLSSPIGAGLLIGLLAAAALVGLGLRRLTGLLGAPAADDCPLEEAP